MIANTTTLGLTPLTWRHFTTFSRNPAGDPISLVQAYTANDLSVGAGGVVTVTLTGLAGELRVGDYINWAGSDAPLLNTHHFISEITDANTFKFTVVGLTGSPSVGTFTLKRWAQKAIIRNKAANADITLGPSPYKATWKTLAAAAELTLEAPRGAKFDLADWYVDSASNAQEIHILYV